MPKYSKKNRTGRKRTTKSYASKSYVKRQLTKVQELKSWNSSGNHNIDNTLELALSNSLIGQGVIEGTGGDERIGRKIVVNKFHIKMTFQQIPGAGTQSSGNTFTALVLDKEFNGTAPTVAQIFDSPGSLGGHLVFRNRDYMDRFKVLKSWVHTWNPTNGVAGAQGNTTKCEDFSMKCNLPIEYTDATGDLASMRGNAIFMISGSTGTGMDDIVNCQHARREFWTDGGSTRTSTTKGVGVSWGQIAQQAGFGALASYAMASALID